MCDQTIMVSAREINKHSRVVGIYFMEGNINNTFMNRYHYVYTTVPSICGRF